LLEHSQKSCSPLRQQISNDNEEEKHKYRKVSIRIWQDLNEYYIFWDSLMQTITSVGEVALSIEIYSQILSKYMEKKQDSRRSEPELRRQCKKLR